MVKNDEKRKKKTYLVLVEFLQLVRRLEDRWIFSFPYASSVSLVSKLITPLPSDISVKLLSAPLSVHAVETLCSPKFAAHAYTLEGLHSTYT